MDIGRVIGAVLAGLLIGVVIFEMINAGDGAKRVLRYEKGTYLGQPDTGISDQTRERIRLRGRAAASPM